MGAEMDLLTAEQRIRARIDYQRSGIAMNSYGGAFCEKLTSTRRPISLKKPTSPHYGDTYPYLYGSSAESITRDEPSATQPAKVEEDEQVSRSDCRCQWQISPRYDRFARQIQETGQPLRRAASTLSKAYAIRNIYYHGGLHVLITQDDQHGSIFVDEQQGCQ